jgi:hypothetical protein
MLKVSDSFHLDSSSVMHRNREAFLTNFAEHVNAFDSMVERWMACIQRFGAEGKAAEDPVIASLALLLLKHVTAGFYHLSCSQSFFAWFVLRPGLEAFLFIGKIADDPNNAVIWREYRTQRNAYRDAFSGKGLISNSLPASTSLRGALTHLNDSYMHPNQQFIARSFFAGEARAQRLEPQGVQMSLSFHDRLPELQVHLLAYLNLFDNVVSSFEDFLVRRLGTSAAPASEPPKYADVYEDLATALASAQPRWKTTMLELGLWEF